MRKKSRRSDLLLLLFLCSASVAAPFASGATPDRKVSVASINLCTDQLVLLLADPAQILSLSNLSHQTAGSYYYLQARNYPVNEGFSEQILPLDPGLVLTGPFTPAHRLRQLEALGLKVETVPIADSIDSLIRNIERVSVLLSQPETGQRVVRDMRDRLGKIDAPEQNRPSAAVYDPNGYTVGANTLRGQMIELSGWTNIASIVGIESYGSLSLESLVLQSPDALIESPYSEGTYSRGQSLPRHPAIRQSGLDPLVITIPSRMTICAGPWTIDVIEQLTAERIKLMQARP